MYIKNNTEKNFRYNVNLQSRDKRARWCACWTRWRMDPRVMKKLSFTIIYLPSKDLGCWQLILHTTHIPEFNHLSQDLEEHWECYHTTSIKTNKWKNLWHHVWSSESGSALLSTRGPRAKKRNWGCQRSMKKMERLEHLSCGKGWQLGLFSLEHV